jgi:transposase-like protein
MIVHAITCPFCRRPEAVVKHGTNRGGTARCRCKDCNKTFTPQPNPRRLDPKIKQAIERALDERLAFNALKRTFKVGWDTIARIAANKADTLKKGQTTPS